MATHSPPTNLQVIAPSRAKLRAGDLFVVQPANLGYLFGLVVDTDTRLGGFPGGVILAYIFAPLFATMDPPPPGEISPRRLLIPPFGINRLPWSRGYFHTVEHRALASGDVRPIHVFRDNFGGQDRYVDVDGIEVAKPDMPVGTFGLRSYRTVDDDISRVLGIPLAPADDRLSES
jgi:hypothetical protein